MLSISGLWYRGTLCCRFLSCRTTLLASIFKDLSLSLLLPSLPHSTEMTENNNEIWDDYRRNKTPFLLLLSLSLSCLQSCTKTLLRRTHTLIQIGGCCTFPANGAHPLRSTVTKPFARCSCVIFPRWKWRANMSAFVSLDWTSQFCLRQKYTRSDFLYIAPTRFQCDGRQ